MSDLFDGIPTWLLLLLVAVVGVCWVWSTMKEILGVIFAPVIWFMGWRNLRRLDRELAELKRIQAEAQGDSPSTVPDAPIPSKEGSKIVIDHVKEV